LAAENPAGIGSRGRAALRGRALARPADDLAVGSAPLERHRAAHDERAGARRRDHEVAPGLALLVLRLADRDEPGVGRAQEVVPLLLALIEVLQLEAHVHRLAGMPDPGIEPRIPTVFGWALVSQTLTVAHRSLDA
jgi:hypothetical protein